MKTKKQIANSTADALMLIKKAREKDVIIWDESGNITKEQLKNLAKRKENQQ